MTDYTCFPEAYLFSIGKNKDFDQLVDALTINKSLVSVNLKSSYYCDPERIEDCLPSYLRALSKIPTLTQLTIRSYPRHMTTDKFIKALIAFTTSSSNIELIELDDLDFSELNPNLLTELVEAVKMTHVRMQLTLVTWPDRFDFKLYQESVITPEHIESPPKLSFERLAESVSQSAPTFNVLPHYLAIPRESCGNSEKDLAAVRIQRAWRAKHKREQSLVPHPSFFPALRKRLPQKMDSNPAVPNQPIKAINSQEKVRFLARLKDKNMQHMVDEVLTHHMMYITFHDLLVSLHRCIDRFNQWMIKHPEITHMLVAQDPGKSQGWISALAAHYLTVLPNTMFTLGNLTREHLLLMQHSDRCVLLMLDDGAYSGTQICTNLSETLYVLPELEQLLDVFVIIPFMSTKALRALTILSSDLMEHPKFKGKLAIHLITDKRMPSLAELPLSSVSQSAVSVFRGKDKCVCLTEWKKPDDWSVPPLFSEAYIDWSLSRDGQYYHFNTMPEIKSPYRISEKATVAESSSGTHVNPSNKGCITINNLVPSHRDFARLGDAQHQAIAIYLAEKYQGTTLDANVLVKNDEFMHHYIYPLCLYGKKKYAHLSVFRERIIDALYVNQTPRMKANLEEYLRLIVIPGIQDLYHERVDADADFHHFILQGQDY